MVASLVVNDPIILQFDDALTRLTSEADVINYLTEIVKKSPSPEVIVHLTELRIISNPIDKKLAVLYLIDSIMKNIGSPYPKLFSNHIYQIFTSSFNEAEGTIVESMKHVFNTWKTFSKFPIFSPELLSRIEERMAFIENLRITYNSRMPIGSGWPESPANARQNAQEVLEMAVLKDMYIRLHPLKLVPNNDQNFIAKLRFLQNALVTELSLKYELSMLLGLSVSDDVPQLLELYCGFQEMKSQVGQKHSFMPIDSVFNGGESEMQLVQISLKQPKSLMQHNKEALFELYYNRAFQCKQCSMRFLREKDLGKHLGDYHLRLKLQRENQAVMSYRQWYLSVDDWLEILGGVKHYSNDDCGVVEKDNITVGSMPEQLVNKIVADDSQIQCAGCGEEFNTFWDHADQLWYYMDTKRMPNGLCYHVKCYPATESPDIVSGVPNEANSKKRNSNFVIDSDMSQNLPKKHSSD